MLLCLCVSLFACGRVRAQCGGGQPNSEGARGIHGRAHGSLPRGDRRLPRAGARAAVREDPRPVRREAEACGGGAGRGRGASGALAGRGGVPGTRRGGVRIDVIVQPPGRVHAGAGRDIRGRGRGRRRRPGGSEPLPAGPAPRLPRGRQ